MILISATENDPHAQRVAHLLTATHGEEVFVFDTSRFPGSVGLTGQYGNGGSGLFLITDDGGRIPMHEVTAFWWRRPQPMEVDVRITDADARNFAFQECVSALYGFLECCDALWVNNIQNDTAAEYKPFQLKIAAEHGFEIPATLITNVPEELMGFWREHQGSVVYKAFNQRGMAWRPTRVLTEQDIAMLGNVRYAPVIFQAIVPGIRDVRVTVIGDTLFATEFDIEQMTEVDYRLRMTEIPCHPHVLPAAMTEAIHGFMDDLSLEYGGIDFRLTPDGRYVFFEINTAGEFLYLQDRTGQPLAEAMAAHLAAGEAARPPRRVRGPYQAAVS
jgi:glutathione synthase/RimK-type ligase-like ATP-grasp enzyme